MLALSWSLALTQPNRELSTARALTRLDFPNHVFKIRKRVARRGRTVERLFPAYPGYVFLAANNAWHILRERVGISRFVQRYLPKGTVPALVASADPDDVLPTPELPSARFRPGDRVRIGGMSLLSGHVALFQNLVSETEAIVLIDWMGRWVPVPIDERDLALDIKVSSRVRRRRRRRGRSRKRGPPVH